MERPEFDIRIDKRGRVSVEVRGARGPRCMALADLIRDIVGREESREKTAEFYAPDGRVRIDLDVRAQR